VLTTRVLLKRDGARSRFVAKRRRVGSGCNGLHAAKVSATATDPINRTLSRRYHGVRKVAATYAERAGRVWNGRDG